MDPIKTHSSRSNDLLDRHPDFDGADLIYEPDSYTINYDTTWPFVDSFQGHAFGLPYQGNVSGHYYNIDLYDQYGVPEPSADWTYSNEWLDAAKQATDPDNEIYGTRIGGGGDIHYWTPISWGFGAKQFISSDGTHTEHFDNGGDRGFQFAVDLIHKHGVSPATDAQREVGGRVRRRLFGREDRGRIAARRRQGQRGDQHRQPLPLGAAPQPKGDVTGTVAVHRTNQGHYVIDSARRQGVVEAVVDFLVWMAGPKMQARAATIVASSRADGTRWSRRRTWRRRRSVRTCWHRSSAVNSAPGRVTIPTSASGWPGAAEPTWP